MQTTPPSWGEAEDHVIAARKLLAHPAAHARRLATSPSPHARAGAEEERKRVERLRHRLLVTLKELAQLDENLAAAQDWHDRYERVQRM
jgi:hypothetical protein